MKSRHEGRNKGIYLLPNLFTTAALFAGFYAIIAAIQGRFELAGGVIFIAMVLDGLDGRVARATNTQTAFGAEYDSLADMVSFGVAPALVVYQWALHDMGKLGWLAAFLYTACAALRLARFNTQVGVADKRFFQGLPSPAAAALLAGMVWVGEDLQLPGESSNIIIWVLTVMAGLLMVSNVRFNSFKDFDPRNRVPFVVMLVVVLVFVAIALSPPQVLFAAFLIYAFSGPIMTLIYRRQRRALRQQARESAARKRSERARKDDEAGDE